VRVFAALASLISAAFILYAAVPDAIAWVAMRFLVGVCFAGVYVVAESWLNDAATNETRGQALSLYMIVQMVGIIASQGIVNFADPSGYTLFVVMSVLVSVSFLPILLSVSPAPAFGSAKPMSLRQLYQTSPLGCVGMFMLGGINAAIFAMAAVFGTEKGLSVAQISAYAASVYIGGLVLQFPIGWASDRMDRRRLIMGVTAFGALAMLVATPFTDRFVVLLGLGFVVGGVGLPLYSLLIAYTNDFLDPEDMASASGRLLFMNGFGAMLGPIVIGTLMTAFGADIYFAYLGTLFAAISGYALYRMSRRTRADIDERRYAPVFSQSTSVALYAAQEAAIEMAEGDDKAQHSPVAAA
jgi:MFS family permease